MKNRREFLKESGAIAGYFIASNVLVTTSLLRKAQAMTALPLADLHAAFQSDGSQILVPSDADFAAHLVSFNKRTLVTPEFRVLPKTAGAVSQAIQWARKNKVALAIRSGGHSYEGYSQSSSMVIDVRALNSLAYDAPTQTLKVGSGVNLGTIYQYLSQFGQAIPAGSCPPVGVAGHTLGGGFGLIARKFGLACDSVISMQVVDAQGRILTVDANQNTDLFWALRGGGNGSFGIVTEFTFKTYSVSNVATFGLSWCLPADKALEVVKAWQNWAPHAPDDITCIFKLSRTVKGDEINVHCAGVTVGSVQDLNTELKNLTQVSNPDEFSVKPMAFFDSVKHFSGGFDYESVYMKAKSDYLFQPMSDQGIQALLQSLMNHPLGVVAIFDSYGGAIGRVKNGDTAFVHRENAHYVIQYYSEWTQASDTPVHLQTLRSIYAAMRPYVSGACYVNYCDLDLPAPRTAYWGANLSRLMRIKAQVDPDNFFNHAQSVQPAAR